MNNKLLYSSDIETVSDIDATQVASKKILITSALPYVNNIPHLGNIIGCVLPADVIARYHRMRGNEVLYICGADEYGTATEVKAREDGVSPRELCNNYYERHKQIYHWFNISFDIFGRTSTPNPRTDKHFHTEISQKIFSQLYHNGFLEEKEVTQLFCPSINRFVADRFITGKCPKCGDMNARGDQCDKCQAVYESIEIIDPHLKGDSSAVLEIRNSRHLFLRLDILQPKIETWFNEVKTKWPANAIAITEEWLEKGLKPRCITRDMEWGTPLPDDVEIEGKEHKVMYNWFDAPIGYISISGADNSSWWQNDPSVRLIQFMGVDNVPFHSILFPASLIGSNDNYTLVSELVSARHLNYEGRKFSKTDNRGIFGDEVMLKGIHPDYWRYYLMKIRPQDSIGSTDHQRGDANFNWIEFVNTCNADLCKNIGNLVHRTFDLIHKYYNGTIDMTCIAVNPDVKHTQYKSIEQCDQSYQMNSIGTAIWSVLELSDYTNKYLTQSAPWTLYKKNSNDPTIGTIIAGTLSCVWTILKMLQPIMPETISRILSFVEFKASIATVKTGFTPFFTPIKV